MSILVPRGRDPFGHLRGSRPLARSNSGSPHFTDFSSLCACLEPSPANVIGSGLNLLCFQSHSKPECRWTGLACVASVSVQFGSKELQGDEWRGRKEGNACRQTPGFWKPPTRKQRCHAVINKPIKSSAFRRGSELWTKTNFTVKTGQAFLSRVD